MSDPPIRPVQLADAAAILGVYAPIVRSTAISFEETPPDVQEVERRIEAVTRTHPWLVAVATRSDGEPGGSPSGGSPSVGAPLLGYAYASAFRARAAYRWSAEVTAYVAEGARGRGVGRALYLALLEELRRRGVRRALAAITLPNPASEALHRSVGFEDVGTFRRVGFKHGAWHDVLWLQRAVDPAADPYLAPRPLG